MGKINEAASEQFVQPKLEEISPSIPTTRTASCKEEKVQNGPEGHIRGTNNSIRT